jgi:glutamyl-tRNA synthetase
MQYWEQGYLPEALLNYLVRLGWSHGDQEVFSVEEMIELFEVEAVNRAPSAFNTDKLNWLNQHYIKEGDPRHVARLLSVHLGDLGIDPAAAPPLHEVVEAQRERASTLIELAEISRFYYRDFDSFEPQATKKAFKGGADESLRHVREKLAALPHWEREPIHQAVADSVAELDVGFGKVAMPLRVAVTGGAPSPDLDLTLYLVGREATLRRIDKAIAHIQASFA